MAFSTTAVIVQASASNAAGGTTTSGAIDCGATPGRAGGLLTGKITNGATGPTVECVGYVETSTDGVDWTRLGPIVTGGTTAAVATGGSYSVAPGTRYVRVAFVGNTGQPVTVQADLHRADIS